MKIYSNFIINSKIVLKNIIENLQNHQILIEIAGG